MEKAATEVSCSKARMKDLYTDYHRDVSLGPRLAIAEVAFLVFKKRTGEVKTCLPQFFLTQMHSNYRTIGTKDALSRCF